MTKSWAWEFVRNWSGVFINHRQIISLRHLPRYFAQFVKFRRQVGKGHARFIDSFPQLTDLHATTPFDPHYFYQSAWLSRQLAADKPDIHVDVGSSVMVVGVISGQIPTVFVDFRPLAVRLPGLSCIAGNIVQLPFADASVVSLSCLHVIEHIGLGRYGDPLDPNGARQAAAELQRTVAHGGHLYLSTPIGRERICFNAHRVFAPETIVSLFDKLDLVEFSYVSDDGSLLNDTLLADFPAMSYACGLFKFRKLSSQ
jgi:SAM-dependent methyltransferase